MKVQRVGTKTLVDVSLEQFAEYQRDEVLDFIEVDFLEEQLFKYLSADYYDSSIESTVRNLLNEKPVLVFDINEVGFILVS